MRVLFVTSEMAPWVKTGGLGDVAAALPAALRAQGHDVKVLLPYYPALRAAFPDAPTRTHIVWLGGALPEPHLREAEGPDGVPLLLIDHGPYYDRPGNPYVGPGNQDWPDNAMRFGLLGRVAALLGAAHSPLDWRPDILHCNDWQAGLAPVFLSERPDAVARSVMTVHNLAFQGVFGREMLAPLGLPDHLWRMDGLEYHGLLSFLKAGLQFADRITTVSPTYAREISTDAEGMGLAGLLRHRADRLSGILNGIDATVWNPVDDPLLPAHFSAAAPEGKATCKAAVQAEMGLEEREDLPLFAVVSRLTYQKGLDLLPGLERLFAELPAQLAVLGSGESGLEGALRAMAARNPGRIAARIGFDEGLAHRIEAGSDVFMIPSRFEPCGLNQMYSLRYGTLPLVRATGGLADTVRDYGAPGDEARGANGFVFGPATGEALAETIRRAVAAWKDPPSWRRIQANGMAADYSWAGPAYRYGEVYAAALGGRDGR